MFLAFSMRRKPATGELMVETHANSPFQIPFASGKYAILALENRSGRTKGKSLSYYIFVKECHYYYKVADMSRSCHGNDFLLLKG